MSPEPTSTPEIARSQKHTQGVRLALSLTHPLQRLDHALRSHDHLMNVTHHVQAPGKRPHVQQERLFAMLGPAQQKGITGNQRGDDSEILWGASISAGTISNGSIVCSYGVSPSSQFRSQDERRSPLFCLARHPSAGSTLALVGVGTSPSKKCNALFKHTPSLIFLTRTSRPRKSKATCLLFRGIGDSKK